MGGPFSHTQFKLIDCPEMNYTHLDKDENGYDRPRGEVCIKSLGNMDGYFKNEKATNETITVDGKFLIIRFCIDRRYWNDLAKWIIKID